LPFKKRWDTFFLFILELKLKDYFFPSLENDPDAILSSPGFAIHGNFKRKGKTVTFLTISNHLRGRHSLGYQT